MIYLGTDIININRIRNNLIDNRIKFLNKVFNQKEIEYCSSKSDPAIHFAGRFAAKEAVKKAILSAGVLKQISIKNIGIISFGGIPKVSIQDILYSQKDDVNIKKNPSYSIEVSISHTDNIASATAILTHFPIAINE